MSSYTIFHRGANVLHEIFTGVNCTGYKVEKDNIMIKDFRRKFHITLTLKPLKYPKLVLSFFLLVCWKGCIILLWTPWAMGIPYTYFVCLYGLRLNVTVNNF